MEITEEMQLQQLILLDKIQKKIDNFFEPKYTTELAQKANQKYYLGFYKCYDIENNSLELLIRKYIHKELDRIVYIFNEKNNIEFLSNYISNIDYRYNYSAQIDAVKIASLKELFDYKQNISIYILPKYYDKIIKKRYNPAKALRWY